ncbi:C-X-C chemokine receptor type 3 isoform X1 [Labrus bergylta]|uniref:C-X-C chemokine receptor type 3 isoform X1 n=1 Tax=Labrus bergylta TaxID=56723 RepID=UPI003313DD3B
MSGDVRGGWTVDGSKQSSEEAIKVHRHQFTSHRDLCPVDLQLLSFTMDMDVEFGGLFLHNSTYDYGDYEKKVEPVGGTAVFVSVLYSLALVVGLFGNGVLLGVLVLKRRSWSLSDTFILHQSVADVLLLLTLPLLATQAAQFGWYFRIFLCKFSGAVFNTNFYCGILLLVCISLDRYLSIVHGIQLYSQKRDRFVHISCLLVWLISLILPIPDWTFLVVTRDYEDQTLCVHFYSRTDWQLVSRLLHLTLGFLLPTAAIIICCSFILLQFQRSSKVLKTQRAFTRVILPLVGVFFLCWTPYNITLTVDTISSTGNTEGSLQTALMVTKALGCVHACLRPVLYLGLCGNFRKRALTMLRCDTVQHDGPLWELCVGDEAPSDQSPDEVEEQKQMSVDQQVQSTHC